MITEKLCKPGFDNTRPLKHQSRHILGVDASPLMTWGTIEGTPFRLDAGDVTIDSSPGPTFKIPEPKQREVLAHKLAEKASKRHREERRQALAAAAFGK